MPLGVFIFFATEMAADTKAVSIVPLNGANDPTWKILCRMALMRDGVWGIVDGSEVAPPTTDDRYQKFMSRSNKVLVTIVLSLDPSLLYLIGDLQDPKTVWTKLSDQFQKKTWENKLVLRRCLHALQLKEGDSVQEHIKVMTETFIELAIVGVELSDEDLVVYLLASQQSLSILSLLHLKLTLKYQPWRLSSSNC